MPSVERNNVEILGVRVDRLEEDLVNTKLVQLMREAEEKGVYIVTPNPEFILLAQRNNQLKDEINAADLAIPDGAGLVFAGIALHGSPPLFRKTGVELAQELLEINEKHDKKNILVLGDNRKKKGGLPSLETGVDSIKQRYPNTRIEGWDPGKLSDDLLNTICERATKYEIVFIALPMEWQLKIMKSMREARFVGVAIGIGGAIDMFAGSLKRAPEAWRNMGMEWLWRLTQEPTRIMRILDAVIVFPCKIAYTAWRNGHLVRSVKDVFTYLAKKPYGRY